VTREAEASDRAAFINLLASPEVHTCLGDGGRVTSLLLGLRPPVTPSA
jgi:hypothetical protein